MTTEFSPFDASLPNATKRQYWAKLYGAANPLAICAAASKHPGLVVVVTPDMLSATKLRHELLFFQDPANSLQILHYPDWETLPYDQFSPHQDIISERLLSLYQLPLIKKGIVIIPVNTLMHFTTDRAYVEAVTFLLRKGDELDSIEFQQKLERSGYRHVSQVMEHGEFCVKGSLIDIYPMGSHQPFRIDLFDNEVDSIRTFDSESQRSDQVVQEIRLLPANEFPLTENAIAQFRQAWRSNFTGNPAICPLYESITKGQYASGIEYYLPLFFPQAHTLFNYLSPNTVIIQVGNIEQKAQQFWQEFSERYEQLRHDIHKPILEPKQLILQVPELFRQFNQFPQVLINSENDEPQKHAIHFNCKPPLELKIESKSQEPLAKLKNFLQEANSRVLFCAESLGRRESLLNLLNDIHVTPTSFTSWQQFLSSNDAIGLTVAPLDLGMVIENPPISLITENQLFGQQVMQRRLRNRVGHDPENIIRNLTELKIGAPVVHLHHGVGKYVGLQLIKTGDYEAEYLTLEYAGGDKLYVPVCALHLIARYTGADDERAPMYQLGTKKWDKIKQKTAEKIRDVAAELLNIYAKREAKVGYAFTQPNSYYHTFSTEFPFEETPDQLKAINEVIHDMTEPRPMDRLVCGDVGFGKTEVAMRAAFICTQDNKQCAVLVPTTLLAEQHLQNFKDRFANWPIKIAALSRFQAKKEQQEITRDIAAGKIDIVIGTHKLLQSDIKFKELGLLIIDEEHRFGVSQKEKIKALKNEVDILTLTATPIPRTLNMSLSGVRDLSIIATPPARRLSIKTFVREYNPSIIREAILREILRGGQVYFLHNDVQTMLQMCDTLEKLIPEAKINHAHGQMTERSLEKVMSDFYHSRFNVLVCSTIVESGIDVPTANTMIINKASNFGLAQLHQLRGRVGRSHHQAYAYLLTPPVKTLTKDAVKRLDAIESLEDLGAGFMLATYDLEIRGAGEILGEDQSGFIEEVGFYMYTEMLEHAVKSLREGKEPDSNQPITAGSEIDLKISALIPEKYIPDVNLRLTLYKRIANCKNAESLQDIQVELIDRFGLLPTEIKNLIKVSELKLICDQLGIAKIDVGSQHGRAEFIAEPKINVNALLNLVQKQGNLYQLEGSQALKFKIMDASPEGKIKQVEQLLRVLKM